MSTDLVPTSPSALTFAETMLIAEHFVKAKIFPNLESVSQAVVKIMAGRELGLGPFAAMDSFDLIKGRIAPSGNLLAGLIKASAKYDYEVVRLDAKGCILAFHLKNPDGSPGRRLGEFSFTEEDAKRAGLATGENYKKYPVDMFFNRAMSAGQKKYCPDVTLGVRTYTPDELGVQPKPAEVVVEFTPSSPAAAQPRHPASTESCAGESDLTRELNALLEDCDTTVEACCKALRVDPKTFDRANDNQVRRLVKLLTEKKVTDSLSTSKG